LEESNNVSGSGGFGFFLHRAIGDEWCSKRTALSSRHIGRSALPVDRELAFGERLAVGRHVAKALAVDGQLVVAHDHLDIGCSPEACFRQHCENLFIELDEQFVRSGHDEGQAVEVVARSAKFSLGPSHVNHPVDGREPLDCSYCF